MKVEDFSYELPEELIAQTPLANRTASRMLVVNRKNNIITDEHFYNIAGYLSNNDVLVFNDTKVLPARLYGFKIDTKASIEILLLRKHPLGWEVLVRPVRRVKVGTIIAFQDIMKGEIIKKAEDGICIIRFDYRGVFLEILETLGEVPLPPYIHKKISDPNRYQTVYATNPGSAAAPTAGLHFDKEILNSLKAKGVNMCYITLHVGLGTFRPVSTVNVEEHHMHTEYYEITPEAAQILNDAKSNQKRIVAVGTTSARVLEAAASDRSFHAGSGDTDIFIYPGYKFKTVDALITNFHLPKSTLLMMISAFYERTKILDAYKHAVNNRYRFFSFGDAMFII